MTAYEAHYKSKKKSIQGVRGGVERKEREGNESENQRGGWEVGLKCWEGRNVEEPLEELVAYLEDQKHQNYYAQDVGEIQSQRRGPVNRIMVAFAITVAIRAELAREQFALY